MGNAITQDTRALWLMLQRDGGWWTVAMLTHHWRPTFQPYEVQQAVDALEAGGFLDSRDQAGTRIYAFTSSCKSLPDLAVAGQPGALA
ncbi:MAG: hypothetical protein Q8N06_06805 [Hydrogenophaga sp.]|nr:hypothetical protein [Hydrogenophaga sp.]